MSDIVTTADLFRRDSYKRATPAVVTGLVEGGFITDQTVFYPRGGGQPGDSGSFEGGVIIDCVKGEGASIVHLTGEGVVLPELGSMVQLTLNWDRRYRLMRMHSALHILCSLVAAPVTGGAIGDEKSRLDFDLEDSPDKALLTEQLNAVVAQDHAIILSEITDAQLDANPDLVRTMSVKPPRNAAGVIRMVRIGEGDSPVDYQPCGGTHVARTGEVGRVEVAKIEKKGRQNRRVSLVLLD